MRKRDSVVYYSLDRDQDGIKIYFEMSTAVAWISTGNMNYQTFLESVLKIIKHKFIFFLWFMKFAILQTRTNLYRYRPQITVLGFYSLVCSLSASEVPYNYL